MKHTKLAFCAATILAAMATPALSGGYVKYTCTIDGYRFDIARHGGTRATVRDTSGQHVRVFTARPLRSASATSAKTPRAVT